MKGNPNGKPTTVSRFFQYVCSLLRLAVVHLTEGNPEKGSLKSCGTAQLLGLVGESLEHGTSKAHPCPRTESLLFLIFFLGGGLAQRRVQLVGGCPFPFVGRLFTEVPSVNLLILWMLPLLTFGFLVLVFFPVSPP